MEKNFLNQSLITDKRIINKIFKVKLTDYLDMSFIVVDKNFEAKIVRYFLDSTGEDESIKTVYWRTKKDLENIFKESFDLNCSIGIEDSCPYILVNSLVRINGKLRSISKDLNFKLSVKSLDEIKKIKTLSAINEAVIFKTTNNYTTTINELEAAHVLRTNYEDYNIYNLPIEPRVSFGEIHSENNHINSNTYLKEEIPISVEVFCEKNDINTTLARTYYYGNNNFTKLEDMYRRLFNFHIKLIELLKAGSEAKEVYEKSILEAKKLNIENSIPKYFGYGIGIKHIERPLLSKDDDTVLKENMVLAVNSRLNNNKNYNCIIKDLVLIKNNGGEFLSNPQSEIKRISIEGK